MHDAIGRPLKVGDTVVFTAKITQLSPTSDFCNVSIESVHPRRPDRVKENISAINTATLLRANPEDMELLINVTSLQHPQDVVEPATVADSDGGTHSAPTESAAAPAAGETAEEA